MTVPLRDTIECWNCTRSVPDDAETCAHCRVEFERTPLRFGKYRVQKKLGSGGFGDVWLCRDPDVNRPVAVKRIRSIGNPAALESAIVEMHQGGQLDHPNIVTLFEADSTTGVIVYEFLEGGSLADRISAEPTWVRANFLALALQIVSGLVQAHGGGINRALEPRKIVHRDLKPGNILLSRENTAKIADFGVARVLEEDQLAETRTGTRPYMAPEVLNGEKYGADADLHSLGVVFYEMLTGRLPYTAPTESGLVYQKMSGDYVPLKLGADASPEICRIVSHLLETPSGRLKSAEILLRLLEDLSPIQSPRNSIDSMQGKLATIYGLRSENQYPALILMRLNAALHGLTGGLVHPDRVYGRKRAEAYFPRLFSWICALSSTVGVRISDLLALKFSNACPYCAEKPCECNAADRQPDNDRNYKLLADLQSRWKPVINPRPRTFNDYYEELAEIYVSHDTNANEMSRHAFAEVAEAMDAWLRVDTLTKHDDLVILRLEMADIVAWFFALLRAYRVEVQNYSFVEEFDQLYAHGCYACNQVPCACATVDVKLNMSSWRAL